MRIFDNPWLIVILVVAALLLFGAPKLPGMARSLGQSMRIFKSEVKQMKDDDTPPGSATPSSATQPTVPRASAEAGHQLTPPPAGATPTGTVPPQPDAVRDPQGPASGTGGTATH
ncbi:Sec-independent protein translocase protein TatA [Tersicoccus solisilvae]|uniref:Sec-independent protein translocase protein TatA n=1 Tax=Tersicoccus solisilvae TaxID=1882339 RepID=A0ABQ1NV30_9MICC|nr:Sec-independent protein translocase subunit TatA [Tersicoccus solisilvae]GGC83632.1 Sec-independent protein translocase protein TatA [Tersicoccus solisilvae]